MNQTEIENAYKYCENITKKHAKSFYFAARFLPKEKQKPIYALYALCRHVDDVVDEAEVSSANETVKTVERWEAQLNKVYFNAETLWRKDTEKNELRITNYQEKETRNRQLATHNLSYWLGRIY